MKRFLLFAFTYTCFFLQYVNAQNNNHAIKNGIYETPSGTFTIGIENGILTGFYEYYDHWDAQLHTYLRQDVFYIYGTSSDQKHFKITSGNYGDLGNHVKGNLWIEPNNVIKIVLDDYPDPGCGFDITSESEKNYFPFKREQLLIGVSFVKSKKAILYNYNGSSFSPRKAYLLIGNRVFIIERRSTFTKIAYKSLETGKITDYWISTADLQNPDPALWGNF